MFACFVFVCYLCHVGFKSPLGRMLYVASCIEVKINFFDHPLQFDSNCFLQTHTLSKIARSQANLKMISIMESLQLTPHRINNN